jgi:hypothetical protein
MKWEIKSLDIFFVFAIISLLLAIMFFIFGYSGIVVAVAVPFFTKVFFFLSFVCFILAIIFFLLKKKVQVKIEDK